MVALTFDDGPSDDTPQTLDLLDDLEMQATFFVLGAQVRAHPELVRLIAERGHEVGLHGFDHRHHLGSTPWAVVRDLRAAVAAHEEVLGRRPRFYRPPYGQLSAATLVEARRQQLEVVLWSRWGKEFAERSPHAVFERLRSGLMPGAILLLHDTDVSCRPGTSAVTRAVLPLLADGLSTRALRAVSLGRLLYERLDDVPAGG